MSTPGFESRTWERSKDSYGSRAEAKASVTKKLTKWDRLAKVEESDEKWYFKVEIKQ